MHYWKKRTSFHADQHFQCVPSVLKFPSVECWPRAKCTARVHTCALIFTKNWIYCVQKAWKHQPNKPNLDEKFFCNLLLWMNITTVVMLCTTDAKKMTQFHFLKIDFNLILCKTTHGSGCLLCILRYLL